MARGWSSTARSGHRGCLSACVEEVGIGLVGGDVDGDGVADLFAGTEDGEQLLFLGPADLVAGAACQSWASDAPGFASLWYGGPGL